MTEPMTLRARLAAPVKDVHQALTDPAALRVWLAEHTEVDLPERYEFWGRYTPEGDAPRQRLLHADDRTLRLAWSLDGVETTVEITLEEDGAESTILSLSQSHFDYQEMITGSSIRGVLQTFWCQAVANLADYVQGREVGPRCDFTDPVLRGEVVIASPVEKVFHSLVDSGEVSAWFGYPIEIEPHVGGRFAMGGIDNNPQPAKIIDLVPGRSISVDWGPAGVMSWELEGSEGKTRLTFVSSGFDEARPPYAAWGGWLAGVAELRRFHELAGWRPVLLADAA
ncbi:SRPBCC family protein [Sphaerimonospora thailandensis]|uniref:Activator of Hsp90 ATPase homologue 1/2-like C-terminal domain-containing protein n=1 Tax=Sphaerimonospora thailandensis TaxID=795644 RepID=A0A8J3R3T6_9ACTN|nr:SRPBCC family protein [Sphaerimonospora thailandensis]GIH68587.1 hypothetical protein Mth01_08400 [Sphaerimonospora thailandensis]